MFSGHSIGNNILQVVKGIIISLTFCVISLLVFSFILKFTYPSDKVIRNVNQCLKSLAILVGSFFAICGDKGWIKGMFIGFFTIILSDVLFAMTGGNPGFSYMIFVEITFGLIVGALSGIIAINVRPER